MHKNAMLPSLIYLFIFDTLGKHVQTNTKNKQTKKNPDFFEHPQPSLLPLAAHSGSG